MIADHDRDRQSQDFQNMIVSDRRSWFDKMIVSDCRSRKKVSCLTLNSVMFDCGSLRKIYLNVYRLTSPRLSLPGTAIPHLT